MTRWIATCAAAFLSLSCGATPAEMDLSSPPLIDAGVADAIARWESKGSSSAGPGAEEAACAGPGSERALTGAEMEQIFAAAFDGLLHSPRFVAARVSQGLWSGDLLKANIAEFDGAEGARKIWLGDGKIERRIAYVEGGRARQLVLRSSVENPQLVASGPSAAQRDVVLLEVGVRYTGRGGEVLALVDRTARLAAVLAQEGGAWRLARYVDLKGVDESRAALCRAIAAPIPQ
jgi:hypothetical protein